MMQLRILLISDRDAQRGHGRSELADLVSSLDRAGHEVDVFVGADPDRQHRRAQLVPRLEAFDALRERVDRFNPTLIHMLDWAPWTSSNVYRVARRSRIPLVQSMRDFQIHCLNGAYFRENRQCEDCLGHGRTRGIVRRCKDGSISASVGLASTLAIHDWIGSFSRTVSLYLAPTYHARRKLIDGGLPRERVVVRVPYVDIPLPDDLPRDGALYAGPLRAGTGFVTLMQAALDQPNVRIDIAGQDGDDVLARHIPAFNLLGPLDDHALDERMARARVLIHPAPAYTGFPALIVKAFGARLPVIASAAHGYDEMVEDGQTGLLFEPDNPTDLAKKIHWASTHPDAMAEMGRNARRMYQERYSSLRGARQLIDAYDLARQIARGPNFEVEEIAAAQMK